MDRRDVTSLHLVVPETLWCVPWLTARVRRLSLPVDVAQAVEFLNTRIKRQAMIAPGAKNRCPNGYVSFNEKCIQCDKYLQESTNMLVPQECSNASGWNTQPYYCIYFLIIILLTILNKINLPF
ncbi:hypothetical protein HW555_000910 [Spodoptera exigua]|uniref:Uncharacterized protein n=1 Tax=Spodoptera exigua TaxID=7107 RepID=A0A835GU36_SPOEX|nr:hypothetical protein HW555_000910 [Spodoptera exigua]